jgi:hypothetical protein
MNLVFTPVSFSFKENKIARSSHVKGGISGKSNVVDAETICPPVLVLCKIQPDLAEKTMQPAKA